MLQMVFVCPDIPSQPQNTVVESVTFEPPAHLQIIPDRVFDGCISLKSICIPISVNIIGDSAFRHFEALSIVVFESPSTVTKFGCDAFAFCVSLRSINIPSSVVHIDGWCFQRDQRVADVFFESPSQLTSIGYGVFQDCPMMSFLHIPPRLQNLGMMSLLGSSIIHVEVDPESQWFSMINPCLVNLASRFYTHNSSAVISNSIQELGSNAFRGRVCLKTVTFESPAIVVKFVNSAFSECSSLESICIPATVRYIGEICFGGCSGLVSVTFEDPSMLETIDNLAFAFDVNH
jgi:hypothetical protein